MLSAFLITLREGLEAALIVGIVLGYLRQSGLGARQRSVWTGVGVAAFLSALIAFALRMIGAALEEPFDQIFEGTTMLLAVAVLTWMIFWMRQRARFLRRELEAQAHTAVSRGENWGLFSLAFLAVFREGLETALFLAANAFAADAMGTFVGALAGLALAIAAGVLIYASAMRLNVKLFFDVTSILLIVFAAGLLTYSVHEFQEIGWLPLTSVAWDTRWLLDHQSVFGSIVRSLIGYTAQPTWLEVAAYGGYWIVILQAIRWWAQKANVRLIQEQR